MSTGDDVKRQGEKDRAKGGILVQMADKRRNREKEEHITRNPRKMASTRKKFETEEARR